MERCDGDTNLIVSHTGYLKSWNISKLAKENTGDGEQWSLGGTLEHSSFSSLNRREGTEKETRGSD